jgi:hypothetical protein
MLILELALLRAEIELAKIRLAFPNASIATSLVTSIPNLATPMVGTMEEYASPYTVNTLGRVYYSVSH